MCVKYGATYKKKCHLHTEFKVIIFFCKISKPPLRVDRDCCNMEQKCPNVYNVCPIIMWPGSFHNSEETIDKLTSVTLVLMSYKYLLFVSKVTNDLQNTHVKITIVTLLLMSYYVHPPGGWIYYFCFFRRPMSDVRRPASDVRRHAWFPLI